MNIIREKRTCRPRGPCSILCCPEVRCFLQSEIVPAKWASSGDPLSKHSYPGGKRGHTTPDTFL